MVEEQVVRPADCTCLWRRRDIIWLLTMIQEVRPYGAASCFWYLWRFLFIDIKIKRIPASAEGGCANGDISK